jgi:predicted metal-dependent RNase
MRLTFKEIKDEISKIVPRGIEYKADLEAGDIAIFTNEIDKFVGSEGLAGKISKKIKRRVVMRPNAEIVMDKKKQLQSSMNLYQKLRTSLSYSLILVFGKSSYNVRIHPRLLVEEAQLPEKSE